MNLVMVETVELSVNPLRSLCLKICWNILPSSVKIIAHRSSLDLVGYVAFMLSTKPMNLIILLILKFSPLPVGRLPTIDRHMALIWWANSCRMLFIGPTICSSDMSELSPAFTKCFIIVEYLR